MQSSLAGSDVRAFWLDDAVRRLASLNADGNARPGLAFPADVPCGRVLLGDLALGRPSNSTATMQPVR